MIRNILGVIVTLVISGYLFYLSVVHYQDDIRTFYGSLGGAVFLLGYAAFVIRKEVIKRKRS